METVDRLKGKLEALPRVRLAHLPTPLERLDRLSERLGIELLIKRDDETGLAFGGNKARKLEYIMADVLAKGADTFVTWAGVQSNWCRQAAAAARKLGIQPVLILFKRPGLPYEVDGNLLLDFVLDSDIRIVEAGQGQKMMEYEGVRDVVDAVAEELRRKGKRPYLAPIGGSLVEASMDRPWGAVAYVRAFLEIHEQAAGLGAGLDAVVLATGSGGTQAGLLVGAHSIAPQVSIVGISVSESRETMTRTVRSIAERTLAELAQAPDIDEREIVVHQEYLAEGYGALTPEVTEALRLAAETEGILLDPVYTGKAMVGLLDLTRKGRLERGSTVVFLHSGGTPALFPYKDKLLSHLGKPS